MKCSLHISNFLEEISSLSHSLVFLYFFALFNAEGFLSFFFFFYFTILYWFCHSLTWIHHRCTCVPHPEPPRKAFLSLLALLWNSAFRCIYLSFSPLPFTSLLFSAICKAASDSHFAFLHFFFLRMVLITASCTMLQTSIHSSSGTQSYLIPWIFLSLPLYIHKWFYLGHTCVT